MTDAPYGRRVADPGYRADLDVIGRVENTPAGNVALSIGTLRLRNADIRGWHKTGHVTLTPAEARALAIALLQLAEVPS